jgi:hypothetical protein
MSVKVGEQIVISDGPDVELRNIANTDLQTADAINDAIVKINNVLILRDSDGTALKTIYGGLVN